MEYGPAWQYDILFTPSEFGSHTLQFNLSLEYAGRSYTEPSSSIAISTVAPVLPPVSIVPAAVEPKPAPAAPAALQPAGAVAAVAGVALPAAPQTQFPWIVVAILVAVAVPIAAGVAYFLTTAKTLRLHLHGERRRTRRLLESRTSPDIPVLLPGPHSGERVEHSRL